MKPKGKGKTENTVSWDGKCSTRSAGPWSHQGRIQASDAGQSPLGSGGTGGCRSVQRPRVTLWSGEGWGGAVFPDTRSTVRDTRCVWFALCRGSRWEWPSEEEKVQFPLVVQTPNKAGVEGASSAQYGLHATNPEAPHSAGKGRKRSESTLWLTLALRLPEAHIKRLIVTGL